MALAASPTPAADRELTITRTFNAPRALLFRMWTQPEHVARWWGCVDCQSIEVRMDARPNGAFSAEMVLTDGAVHLIYGVFTDVREPEHLALTWTWKRDDGTKGSDTVVTIDLADRDDKTEMTLHQAVFDDVDECSDHLEGWTASLDRLDDRLATD
ncbi:MAG: SRPBCC domain-containing protein [Rhodospirillales bacterium]